jgi:hypothetical protein
MKKYSGQAIAIIMIVLVVATVIGASLYSRMLRNSAEITDTRESQRALEQADSILDSFISSDLRLVQGVLSTVIPLESDGVLTFTRVSELSSFLTTNGIDSSVLNDLRDVWCEEPEANSSIEISISYAQTEGIKYDVGDVMAINTSNISSVANACTVGLYVNGMGEDSSLFTTKYVYKAADGIVPYKLDDMKLYCLDSSGSCNTGAVAPGTSITAVLRPVTPESGTPSINLNMTALIAAGLYEFRILPLKGAIEIYVIPTSSCSDIFSNYLVRAKVNCKGDTREKQVVIPNLNNMGYSALFDYTIYNGNGVLSPN